MSDYAKSLIRDAVQKILGIIFAWMAVHALAVPNSVKDSVTNWAVLFVAAFLLWLWTAITRWLESQKGDDKLHSYLRAAGRILMLGVKMFPVYITPTPPVIVKPIQEAPLASDATMILPTVPTPVVPPTSGVLPNGDPMH